MTKRETFPFSASLSNQAFCAFVPFSISGPYQVVSAGSAGLSIAHEQHEVVFAISDRPRELRKVVGVQVNSLEAEMAQSSDLIEI